MCGTPTCDPGDYFNLVASIEGKTSSGACREREKMSKVIAPQRLGNHTICKWQLIQLGQNFRVRAKFRARNLRGPIHCKNRFVKMPKFFYQLRFITGTKIFCYFNKICLLLLQIVR